MPTRCLTCRRRCHRPGQCSWCRQAGLRLGYRTRGDAARGPTPAGQEARIAAYRARLEAGLKLFEDGPLPAEVWHEVTHGRRT